jgi:integral membrane sensor domain MASE1
MSGARSRGVTVFTLVAGAYVLGAELSWHSFGSGLAFGFAPAGVDVAALLLTARRQWPVVLAAIAVSEAAVDVRHHVMIAVLLGSVAANVVEPAAGASCVLWFSRGRRPDLGTRGDLARFVAGAAMGGPLAGALIGASVSWLGTDAWWPGLVLQWWAGDGIAVLVIGGPVLLWSRRRAMASARWAELALVVLATAGLSAVALRFGASPFLVFLPILAWAAFRLGDLGAVLAGTAFACVVNYMTAAGYGSLAHLGLSPPARLAVTQAYIAVVVLTGWVLAQEVTGRMSAVHDLADEHAVAVVLQRAVMPTVTAMIPGLDIGACYRQAGSTRQVGGDWYDALALPGGRAYLAVGDVVGHGLAAAEDMTQLRNAGRALAIADHQPAQLLGQLARITDVATRGKYATMAAAIVEPEVSLLTYATAGHPPILIRRAKTGTVEIPPPAAGPPLGIVRDGVRPEYTQNQVCLEPGDIMLMYTDGLIERRGEDLAEGIARVAEQLEGWRPDRAFGPLCERLVSSLNVEPQLDDVCVLAVCRSAPNPDDPGVRAYRAGRG